MLEVEGLMVALIAVAVLRAHRDFDLSRPLTCVFAAGFLAMPLATALLYARMEARSASAREGRGLRRPCRVLMDRDQCWRSAPTVR